jgi:hypothetical protein
MVYPVRVLFGWSCSLEPTRHTHMHGKRERKASKGLLLASCMDDAMVELVELGNGSAQAKERRGSIEETTGRERRARGCSWAAHLVLRRWSSPTRAHGRIRYTRDK